jgi:hypothetical protein
MALHRVFLPEINTLYYTSSYAGSFFFMSLSADKTIRISNIQLEILNHRLMAKKLSDEVIYGIPGSVGPESS